MTAGDQTATGDREACLRPLVVGIGNRFRRDDGVAAAVLDALAAPAGTFGAGRTDVDVAELDGEPTRVVDAWAQRQLVVVVDALADPTRRPGDVVTMRA